MEVDEVERWRHIGGISEVRRYVEGRIERGERERGRERSK